MSITYSEFVPVALVIQRAERMRCVMLSPVAWPALPFFSTLSHEQHDFQMNIIERTTCVWIFSTNFVWNIYHSKMNWEVCYQKYLFAFMSSTRHTRQIFIKTWIFAADFRKIHKYQISLKSIQWEPSCSMRTDGWSVMTKTIVAFFFEIVGTRLTNSLHEAESFLRS